MKFTFITGTYTYQKQEYPEVEEVDIPLEEVIKFLIKQVDKDVVTNYLKQEWYQRTR